MDTYYKVGRNSSTFTHSTSFRDKRAEFGDVSHLLMDSSSVCSSWDVGRLQREFKGFILLAWTRWIFLFFFLVQMLNQAL